MSNLRKKLKLLISNHNIKPVSGSFADSDVIKLLSYTFTSIGYGTPIWHHSSFKTFSILIPEGAKKITVTTTRSSFSASNYSQGYGVSDVPINKKTDYATIIGFNTTKTGNTFSIDLRKHTRSKYVVVSAYCVEMAHSSYYKYTFE